MRIFVGGLVHETNSFSPIATDLGSFEGFFLFEPDALPPDSRGAVQTGATYVCEVYSDVIRAAAADGMTIVPGMITAAEPSAPINLTDYRVLRGRLLDQVRRAMPLDIVVLALHGAQMAGAGEDLEQDCEGDLLAGVRGIVGPQCKVGAVLDLHANVSDRMVDEADILIACKEYPHTDFSEVALVLYRELTRAARGETKPVTAFVRVPMLAWFHSTVAPVAELVARARGGERDGVLSISLIHGFPPSDCVDTSGAVIVSADGDIDLAKRTARTFADSFFALRECGIAPGITASALPAAIAAAPPGLVIVADCADNSGGGAASDSTHILRALSGADIGKVAIAMVWDPAAVDAAFAAGTGARLPMTVGGVASEHSGPPVVGEAEVLSLRTDARQNTPEGSRNGLPLGRSARIVVAGIDVIINDRRQQVFSPDVFTEHGLDPGAYRVLVVKSAQHFRVYFDRLEPAATLYCDGPGLVPRRIVDIGYRRLRRPIWPLDPMPEADAIPSVGGAA